MKDILSPLIIAFDLLACYRSRFYRDSLH